ncbi:MAG: carbohydrate ABC transporter permease [Paenibacillaceae bacterium]|nr:carbohydrate ABC transporter permease [Paenibacillaceae bacterium]
MFSRMTTGEKAFQTLLIAALVLMCVSMLYPFLQTLAISFSTPKEAMRYGMHLFPREATLDAYLQTFKSHGIWTGFGNTVFRTVVGTLLSLAMMTLGAYPLSKKYLPDRTLYTMLIVFTMFFSGGLIPTYLLIKSVGLMDSRLVYIVPVLINTFWMLILRNFFMNIPEELEDSAKIDGANDIRILVSLVVPLSKPILATLALWSAVDHWNRWFDALLYIQDSSKIVAQIFLRRLVVDNMDQELRQLMDNAAGQTVLPETVKAAVLMVTTAPILFIYPFLQKYFVKGIYVGSLKG